jgi:hypothetical protein
MSDDRAAPASPDTGPSIAASIYGSDGPISGGPSDPRTRAAIEAGFAKPAAEVPGNAFYDPGRKPAPLFGGDQARQPAPTNPAASDRMFDATRYQAPDGVEIDPALMGEFGNAARDLGLRQPQAEALLALHNKAIAAQTARYEQTRADWYATTERDFGHDLPRAVDDIKHAVGTGPDAARFYELLEWSGLAVEPAVLRVLRKLARGW